MPEEVKESEQDLSKYLILLYGREKIGKTTFFASFPDAMFITTEPGTKGLTNIYEFDPGPFGISWTAIRKAVQLLENSDRFKTVIIDTADRAYDLCFRYVCDELGIDHAGENAQGKKDYGKSWDAIKSEFRDVILRIVRTGRGVAFTSHSRESTITTKSGLEYTRIVPTMKGQARDVIEPLVDIFLYAEYMRSPTQEEPVRVILSQGDELLWGGTRELPNGDLPRFLPLTRKGGFDILQAAFDGEDTGLDPDTLMPVKTASDVVKKVLRKAGMEQGGKKHGRVRR